jgi:3-methyladenine DNA glycosylase/8-oxoguanine DNA glycosylase
MTEGDLVLAASIDHNYGAKAKRAFSMFDAVIDVILFQNTSLRRAYAMRARLTAAFGEALMAGGRVYHASPTAQQLAAAPLLAIRSTKVGYRDRYIKGVTASSPGAPAWRDSSSVRAMKPDAS